MHAAPKSILLLQLKRIGDTILTAPATAALRRAFPKARQTLVVSAGSGQLSNAFHDVDQVLSYRPANLNLGIWRALIASKFDLCLDFSSTDRSALMARLCNATHRVGYQKAVASKRFRNAAYTELCDASVRDLHTIDYHLALVRTVTQLEGNSENSGFSIPRSLVAPTAVDRDQRTETYAVIHPGTARIEKYWPVDRWARVIEYLQGEHAISCILTGNPQDPYEAAHLQKIVTECATPVENLAGRLSLLQVAATISKSVIAIGVDSAAMHLAAMLAHPQIVLFGPTNPFHWRPRHERASVLLAGNNSVNVNTFLPKHQAAAMTELSTDLVCRAIDARLAAV